MPNKRPRSVGRRSASSKSSTDTLTSTLGPLSKALLDARIANGMSQNDLSRASGVSPRTIMKIERGGGARFDAVIRLARALEQPAEQWLALAGKTVPHEKIESVLAHDRRPARSPFDHISQTPIQYFDRVLATVKERGAPALMCACVTTRPATLVNPEVRMKFQEMLDAGVTLAVCCPYPHPGTISPREHVERPALVALYTQVFGWVRQLGSQLASAIPDRPGQVRLFVPRFGTGEIDVTSPSARPSQAAYLVAPPLRLVDYRPALVKYARSAAGHPEKLELGTYVRYGGGRTDQWMTLYPRDGDEEDQARSDEAMQTWRDYFSDILKAWRVTGERIAWDDGKLVDWQSLPVDP